MRFGFRIPAFSVALVLGLAGFAAPSIAADALNIYSARHYDSDELLYDGFQKATGIPVNVIEGDGPEKIIMLYQRTGGGRGMDRTCDPYDVNAARPTKNIAVQSF